MKNKLIIAIILLVLTFKIQAQTVDSTVIPMKGRTYARIFDSLSTGLIKSRIVSGVLLNRVNITSGVDYWINNDTLSNTSVKQAFYELEQAVFDPLLRTTTKFTTMRSTVEKDKRLAKLPIIAIRHNFEIIDTNAVANGTLQIISGRKIDKNLVAKPYISRQVNIAAIDFDHIYAGTTYFFTFATANTLNNTAQAISSVIITNVSNNTVKTITPNATNQSILFSTAGTYTLKIQVIVGGITYTNFQKVQVSPAYNNSASISSFGPTSICNPMHGVIASTIPFQGMGETFASTSWADYHVYLRSNATCPATTPSNILANISKPIIILDGFDPLDKARNYHILYNDKLLSESNGDKTLLGERLRTLGYDVIILNFPVLGSKAANKGTGIDIPSVVKKAVGTLLVDVNLDGRDGGADFIERNAMILIALIQKVNAALAANSSTNKLVIVGPSMGGQISRYALAYMEKQIQTTPTNTAMNHNTRLWISFDSPHWGANIPLSLQQAVYFLGYTGNQQDAKDSYTQQLYSPAARQMLIEQLNGQNNLEPLRTNYINNVTANGKTNSLGWPQNLRKIALVNGTKTGTRLYNDGDPFLDIVGKKLIGGNFIGLKLKVAEIKTNFLKDNNVNHRIFKGRFSEKNGLSFTIYDQETSINGYNPIRGSVDVSPSGTFNAQQDLHDLFIAGLQKENIRLIYDNNFKPLHSFIPTVSSLGFKNPNFNWSTPLNNRNLLCGGTGGANEIYFDNYFAPTENQDHVFLSAEAAKWVEQEIMVGANPCPVICNNDINGSVDICPNGTSVYEYTLTPAIPTGYTTTWTVPAGAQIVSQSNNSLKLKFASGYSQGNIKAVIAKPNPCSADVILTKNVKRIPAPWGNISYHSYYELTQGCQLVFYIQPNQPNTEVKIIKQGCADYYAHPCWGGEVYYPIYNDEYNKTFIIPFNYDYDNEANNCNYYKISINNGCETYKNDLLINTPICYSEIDENPIIINNDPQYNVSAKTITSAALTPNPCDPIIVARTIKNNETIANNDLMTSVMPNPTNGLLQITSNQEINTIQITNINGSILQKHTYLQNQTDRNNNKAINIQTLQAGIYIVHIFTTHGTETHKIIKL